MQNVADMANISVTKIWQIQETFIFIVMLQFESKTFNDIFLHFFYHTRSYAALRAADLDWIVGPGYSSGGYIGEKPWKTNLEPWKTMKNQPGAMKTNLKNQENH